MQYVLRPRSGAWKAHPDADDPGQRLLSFDMTAECGGAPVGGHNVQVVLGAPDRERHGLDADVALWLPSGWWVTLRNQFADSPGAAIEVVKSAEASLSAWTADATAALGREAQSLSERLWSASFDAEGPALSR